VSFISYAQNAEDVMLWRALKGVSQGFYIDVGAFDPDDDSVTRAFYERGWRGINIEPVEDCLQRFLNARPEDINLRAALDRDVGERPFYVISQGDISGLSTLDPTIAADHAARGFVVAEHRVPVSTLAEVCRQHIRGEIHFLKIDVEGAEKNVLSGADFQNFRPWIVVVEATKPGTVVPAHDEWEYILVSASYRFVWFDGLNRYYVSEEKYGQLSPHFEVPLNLFDDFVRYDAAATPKLGALERQVGELGSALSKVRTELVAAQAALTQARVDVSEQEEKRLRLADDLIRSQQDVAAFREDLAASREDLAACREDLAASREDLAAFREVLAASRAAHNAEEAERRRLEDELDRLQSQKAAVTEDQQRLAAELDRLRYHLRWENGPDAVRTLLPVARLLRRLRGTPIPQHQPLAMAEAFPPHHRGWKKHAALFAYRLVRPVVRPLAWRARSFLMQDLRRVEDLHARLDDLRRAVEQQQATEHQQPGGHQQQSEGVDAALVRSIEDALLTLAVHRSGRP
jgi:FkbM family methyltransferase